MTDSTRTWNGIRKTPKFRASCDSCNEAKVRCSQTRPSCARCNKNRVHCVYGLSQRNGKHSAESYASRNATLGPCRCSEVIVLQLSSLPALLQNERYDFDVELVQFQEAIKLCTSILACNCAGKDYSSVLATSLLISRIICVVERGVGGVSNEESGLPLDMFGDASTISSPKISLGMYPIDEEDASTTPYADNPVTSVTSAISSSFSSSSPLPSLDCPLHPNPNSYYSIHQQHGRLQRYPHSAIL